MHFDPLSIHQFFFNMNINRYIVIHIYLFQMNPSSKAFWPIVAAVSLGVGFVGYCVYFDHKRRSAPEFRQKLKAS